MHIVFANAHINVYVPIIESTAKKPACHGNSSDSHESQMVEVEVLLYKFRRPVAEV